MCSPVIVSKMNCWHLRCACLVHQSNQSPKLTVSTRWKHKMRFSSRMLANEMGRCGRHTVPLPRYSNRTVSSIRRVVKLPIDTFRSIHCPLFWSTKRIITIIFHVTSTFDCGINLYQFIPTISSPNSVKRFSSGGCTLSEWLTASLGERRTILCIPKGYACQHPSNQPNQKVPCVGCRRRK